MNAKEITDKWEKDCPVYEAWGRYVLSNIGNCDFAECVTIRPKKTESLVAKMLSRETQKTYDEIYDKIGIRFVVLTENRIKIIADSIYLKKDLWSIEHKRSSADDRNNEPNKFCYQSDHYIVKNKTPLNHEDRCIDAGVCCEIQIRTMLQHALSQLSHHYIYKQGYSPASIERSIAKCHALSEVMDDSFTTLITDIDALNDPQNRCYVILEDLYKKNICKNIAVDETAIDILNNIHPDYFGNAESKLNVSNIESEFNSRIKEKEKHLNYIKKQREHHQLFKHPVILLAYLIIDMCGYSKNAFPYLTESLKMIYTKLNKNSGDGE